MTANERTTLIRLLIVFGGIAGGLCVTLWPVIYG